MRLQGGSLYWRAAFQKALATLAIFFERIGSMAASAAAPTISLRMATEETATSTIAGSN
jgi:hypothetical protein